MASIFIHKLAVWSKVLLIECLGGHSVMQIWCNKLYESIRMTVAEGAGDLVFQLLSQESTVRWPSLLEEVKIQTRCTRQHIAHHD